MKWMFTIALLLLTFGNVYGNDLSGDLRAHSLLAVDVINKVSSSTDRLELIGPDSDTIFNQLEDMFAQGTLPTNKETYG